MIRRAFLSSIGGSVLVPSLAVAHSPGKVWRLAIPTQAEPLDKVSGTRLRVWAVFFDELRRLGYHEGQNLAVAWYSSADAVRHSELAAQIVQSRPDLVFTPDTRIAAALKAASGTVPIVVITDDPIDRGFAASLARPGGNITGFSISTVEIAQAAAMRMTLLREAAPAASKVAWLISRRLWDDRFRRQGEEAARAAGIAIVPAVLDPPVDEKEYRRVFAGLVRDGADCLTVGANLENLVYREIIAKLAAGARLPAIYGYRENVEAGGLMSFGVDLADLFRQSAGYIDRILKGANPAEMPFQQPAKFELVINRGTARALGVSFPESILARADEVIE
jgi:putative ABC transport system substrate-binding protein